MRIVHASRTLLLLLLPVMLCTCGSTTVTEDTFIARDDAEREAKARMQHWASVAGRLLDDGSIPEGDRAGVRDALDAMRSSLTRYSRLRDRGAGRAMVMAPIQASAAGIVADDATGIGVGDDILLLPLALAAMATYLITDASATEHELTRAWNQVLTDSGGLAAAVEGALAAVNEGTRASCINEYVECQQTARRGFPLSRCQICMDRCIVNNYIWPRGDECKYR